MFLKIEIVAADPAPSDVYFEPQFIIRPKFSVDIRRDLG
jgi:hypothetical protein